LLILILWLFPKTNAYAGIFRNRWVNTKGPISQPTQYHLHLSTLQVRKNNGRECEELIWPTRNLRPDHFRSNRGEC
jgi:hypothetical protein